MLKYILFILIVFACKHVEVNKDEYDSKKAYCKDLKESVSSSQRLETLNNLIKLHNDECYKDFIDVGLDIKEKYRHKNYKIIKEFFELFIPEGTVTDYVLESYERAYLSFLLAVAYYKIGKIEDSQVEIRSMYNEGIAFIYNFGEDPVNLLLQAVMWEMYSQNIESSRPFWQRMLEIKSTPKKVKKLINQRIENIDKGLNEKHNWKIYSIGEFPDIEWEMKFKDSKSGYYQITPTSEFPKACASKKGFLLSTKDWFNKIGMRYSHSYHPLLNVKSWIRLPIGVIYGITTFASGAALAVGGCSVDVAKKGNGVLCELSLRGGIALMANAKDVTGYTVSPDIRHWKKLPKAILVSEEDNLKDDECYKTLINENDVSLIIGK